MTRRAHFALLVLVSATAVSDAQDDDPRTRYDVRTYRLDLRVDPRSRTIQGTGYVDARVESGRLEALQLDLSSTLEVSAVRQLTDPLAPQRVPGGRRVSFAHAGDALVVRLERPLRRGDRVGVGIEYRGSPRARDHFSGFHWEEAPGSEPWIATSCQDVGAHSWWPCKASFFHPEDKPEAVYLNYTVPEGLVAVANGRLAGRTRGDPGWETFHWEHAYPCETYAVTLNVGPFTALEGTYGLSSLDEPVPYAFYVLEDSLEKARVQFEEVPDLLRLFGWAFGPWPFPDAKVGIVETSFWGMEHSTAIAYGSSYPAWCKAAGVADPWAHRNLFFDYILVHQLAHEWWGNAVSVSDWRHRWIHEGFSTYAESLYVEHQGGRERADEYFERTRSWVAEDSRLYRAEATDAAEAYGSVVYVKGAWVLNTLRHYVDDDALWWEALRRFHLRHRHGNADTEDFQRVLEEVTERGWTRFFDEWFYGVGYPALTGEVRAEGDAIVVEVDNPVRHDTPFHVPLDLAWVDATGEKRAKRVEIVPGANRLRIATAGPPASLAVVGLHRVLGRHAVVVR